MRVERNVGRKVVRVERNVCVRKLAEKLERKLREKVERNVCERKLRELRERLREKVGRKYFPLLLLLLPFQLALPTTFPEFEKQLGVKR